MLDTPRLDEAFRAQQDERTWKVSVKRRNALSTVTFPFNPLDAVGWHGDLSVVRINWRDLRPLMSHRAHLPPSAHTTWATGRFVVCTFVPRPFESDPEALRLPFFHNNDDFEEVIFYHKGSFFSRDNIHPGMMTVHPTGFHPRAASEGLQCGHQGRQDGDRRGRGDDRHARRGRCGGDAGRRRVRGLREVLAAAGHEAGCGIGKKPS
jgi:homogentisate 1,2-dioxygenase